MCFYVCLNLFFVKAHYILCYYVIFIHVPNINKVLNLNLNCTTVQFEKYTRVQNMKFQIRQIVSQQMESCLMQINNN